MVGAVRRQDRFVPLAEDERVRPGSATREGVSALSDFHSEHRHSDERQRHQPEGGDTDDEERFHEGRFQVERV